MKEWNNITISILFLHELFFCEFEPCSKYLWTSILLEIWLYKCIQCKDLKHQIIREINWACKRSSWRNITSCGWAGPSSAKLGLRWAKYGGWKIVAQLGGWLEKATIKLTSCCFSTRWIAIGNKSLQDKTEIIKKNLEKVFENENNFCLKKCCRSFWTKLKKFTILIFIFI